MEKQEATQRVKTNWVLNHWFEKAIYVFGWLYTAFIVLAFFVGLFSAMLEA